MLSLTVIVLVATLFFVASYYAGAFYKAWGPLIFGLGFLFFVVSGTLAVMALVGMALNAGGQIRVPRSDPRDRAHLTLQLEVTTLYWSATAVIGALVFATLYLTPHLL
jgi:hypothetical protein